MIGSGRKYEARLQPHPDLNEEESAILAAAAVRLGFLGSGFIDYCFIKF